MLLFRSEKKIEGWRQAEKMPGGQVLTLEQVWALSQRWYSDRLSPDYAGRSIDQVAEIFRDVGLRDRFWHLVE